MKISHILIAGAILCAHSPLTLPGEGRQLSKKEIQKIQEMAGKICTGLMPLYGMALDAYYKGADAGQVKTRLNKRFDADEKKTVFYTQYLEKDALVPTIIEVSEAHARKIMQQYPNNPDIYKRSIEVTTQVSLPPVCRTDMEKVLRQALQE